MNMKTNKHKTVYYINFDRKRRTVMVMLKILSVNNSRVKEIHISYLPLYMRTEEVTMSLATF